MHAAPISPAHSSTMLVLPNTPSTPRPLKDCSANRPHIVSSETLSLRASVGTAPPANHAEVAQYVLRLEQYLDSVFCDLARHCSPGDLEKAAAVAQETQVSLAVAWTNVLVARAPSRVRIQKTTVEWTLATEIVAAIFAKAEAYMMLGADLVDDLMHEAPVAESAARPAELDEKWRLVAEHYKSAILLLAFGQRLQSSAAPRAPPGLVFHPSVFALLERICNIGIQMSILYKSSWANRASLSVNDLFMTANNGVLCRVAIWVLNEVLACQNIIQELQHATGRNLLGLNYDKWPEYLGIFLKYVTAYSALFLAIENYQKSRLGLAIGLLNFALLTLQSRTLGDAKKRGLARLTHKLSGRRNDNFIASLQSVTSLDIDKSVFLDLSGAMLGDLSLLFDQIVLLHLHFSKENDNLRFEPVADWKDSRTDLKWPLGAKIPVLPPKDYCPKLFSGTPQKTRAFSERGDYF